jgi:hypothetical protein
MKLVERNGLRILTPSCGHVLYDPVNDIYSEKVYLGKGASPDSYEEVMKEDAINDICDVIPSIIETSENQYQLLDTTFMAIDEVFCLIEPILAMMPMTMSLEREVRNPMVELYVVMIQRGLKTIDQVPERYREDVKEILKVIEE